MKHAFDRVEDEEILVRGALYLPELAPGFGYQAKLADTDKEVLVKKLQELEKKILEKIPMAKTDYAIDTHKPRILLGVKNLRVHKDFFHSLGLLTAIIKEHPDLDVELEVDFLK